MRRGAARPVALAMAALLAGCASPGPPGPPDPQSAPGRIDVATHFGPQYNRAGAPPQRMAPGAGAAGGDLAVYLVDAAAYGDAWERRREAAGSSRPEPASAGDTLRLAADAESAAYGLLLDPDGRTAFRAEAPKPAVVRFTVVGGRAPSGAGCEAFYVPAPPVVRALAEASTVAVPFGLVCNQPSR